MDNESDNFNEDAIDDERKKSPEDMESIIDTGDGIDVGDGYDSDGEGNALETVTTGLNFTVQTCVSRSTANGVRTVMSKLRDQIMKVENWDASISELKSMNGQGQQIVLRKRRRIPVITQSTEEEEEFGFEGVAEANSFTISSLTRKLLGPHLLQMGILKIYAAQDFFKITTRGVVVGPGHDLDLLFIACPLVEGKASKVNLKNQPKDHDHFWNSQMVWRESPENGNLNVMELAVKTPEIFLNVNERILHQVALENLGERGPVVNGWTRLHLYNKVAIAFLVFQNSDIVKMAVKAGFTPLFMMRRVAVARNTRPQLNGSFTNGWRFTSVALAGHGSILSLVGFWKQLSHDVDDCAVMTVLSNGHPLSTRDTPHIRI